MFGKRNKYSFNGDGNLDCEFLTSTFNDGYSYSVGLVNHFKKEVSPCHGCCYPNRQAKSLMNYALKLGYTYVDSEMPSIKNKTLLKKFQLLYLKSVEEWKDELIIKVYLEEDYL